MKKSGFCLVEILIAIAIVGLLVAIAWPVLAPRTANAAEAQVTTEWHPASWVEGGYDDRNTIVLSSGETFKASDSSMQIRKMTPMEMERGKRVFDWARKKIDDQEKNRSTLDEIEYEQKMNKHHGVLIPAIDYPERIPAPADVIEKPKLHGPSTGYRGPRKRIKSYAGSRIQTWSFMPTQTRYE